MSEHVMDDRAVLDILLDVQSKLIVKEISRVAKALFPQWVRVVINLSEDKVLESPRFRELVRLHFASNEGMTLTKKEHEVLCMLVARKIKELYNTRSLFLEEEFDEDVVFARSFKPPSRTLIGLCLRYEGDNKYHTLGQALEDTFHVSQEVVIMSRKTYEALKINSQTVED